MAPSWHSAASIRVWLWAEKLGSKVTILNVTEVFPAYAARVEFSNIAVIQAIEVHQKMGEEFAQTVLAAAAALAAKRNVECESVHVGEKCGQPRRSWRFPKKEVAI